MATICTPSCRVSMAHTSKHLFPAHITGERLVSSSYAGFFWDLLALAQLHRSSLILGPWLEGQPPLTACCSHGRGQKLQGERGKPASSLKGSAHMWGKSDRSLSSSLQNIERFYCLSIVLCQPLSTAVWLIRLKVNEGLAFAAFTLGELPLFPHAL